MARQRVLVLLDYFLPGEKAGGPIRTVSALLHHFGDRAEFSIVTRDRDLGDSARYPNLSDHPWTSFGNARCCYLRPTARTPWAIARLLRSTPHDLLYVNTLFSVPFALIPLALRRAGIIGRKPLVLAPRGQLNPGALAFRPLKKRFFLAGAKLLDLFRDITWQATSDQEVEAIHRSIGEGARVKLAPNLRIPIDFGSHSPKREPGGPLRVVFVSRISPKKNLDGALKILAGVQAPVRFDIYGAREHSAYWRTCEELIRDLPENVTARYCGVVAASEVGGTLGRYDLMLLPTHDENFGHVIAEALEAGCSPLISDRTPWRDLADRGVGWDLPLEDVGSFRAVLDACANESPAAAASRTRAARAWMATLDNDTEAVDRNARLLGIYPEAA